MSRSKVVVAWAVVDADGDAYEINTDRNWVAKGLLEGERLVHLTEAPTDAVARAERAAVKAAEAWSRGNDGSCSPSTMGTALARRRFWAAVDRLQKARKRAKP